MENCGPGFETDNYPPPAPPLGKKADIFDPAKFKEIDKRAKEASEKLWHSFPDLLDYLTKDLTTDLQKLRCIFMWMGSSELLDKSKYPCDLPDSTPYWHLKTITENPGSFCKTNFFELLCRMAGMPCKVVKGYSKEMVGYDVGDDIKWPNNHWTAVFVDGSWRIVDTSLAFTGYHAESYDWILVEDAGQAVRERISGQRMAVTHIQGINESCFLPDPEHFIYFNCSLDPSWQLLPEPWSKEKFVKTPVFTRLYLRTSWHLADKHEAVVETPGGRCSITFDQVPEGEDTIKYRLFYNETRSKKNFPSELQLDSYIRCVTKKHQQFVLVRFYVSGIYKLEILNGNNIKLCELLLRTTGKIKADMPFPDIPDTGLGFSQAAIKAGLVDPSREEGLVVAREGEKVRFRFRTKKPLDVVTHLVHTVLPSQQLDCRVTQEEDDDLITIHVNVPWHAQNPEFGLQVDAKPKDSEEKPVNVLNYLLTSDRQLVHSISGAEQQRRDELVAAMSDDDTHRLESAIREFRIGRMNDNDLLQKAFSRLYDLHHSAIEGAKTDQKKLETTLKDAEQSQVACLLLKSDWLKQAQNTYRWMRRLSSVKHKVQSLSKKQGAGLGKEDKGDELLPMQWVTPLHVTNVVQGKGKSFGLATVPSQEFAKTVEEHSSFFKVSEVQTYSHPHPGVRTVVVATYTLLGENVEKMKQWKYVQSLLRRHGNQSIIQLIGNHDVSACDNQRVERASSLLETCTPEEARSISIGVAAFYNWSKGVVEAFAETKNNSVTED